MTNWWLCPCSFMHISFVFRWKEEGINITLIKQIIIILNADDSRRKKRRWSWERGYEKGPGIRMSHDCGRCSNDNGKLRQKWVGVTVCRRFSNKLVIGKRICNICNIGRKLQHNFIYLVSYCTYEWKLFIYSTRDLYFCDKLYLLFSR